jgi:hypothetical protein
MFGCSGKSIHVCNSIRKFWLLLSSLISACLTANCMPDVRLRTKYTLPIPPFPNTRCTSKSSSSSCPDSQACSEPVFRGLLSGLAITVFGLGNPTVRCLVALLSALCERLSSTLASAAGRVSCLRIGTTSSFKIPAASAWHR